MFWARNKAGGMVPVLTHELQVLSHHLLLCMCYISHILHKINFQTNSYYLHSHFADYNNIMTTFHAAGEGKMHTLLGAVGGHI